MEKVSLPSDFLQKAYWFENKSLRELAVLSRHDVKTLLKNFNACRIRRRNINESWRLRREKKRKAIGLTEEALREKYFVERRSIATLAKEFGIHKKTLLRYMREFGMRPMTKSEASLGKPKSASHRKNIILSISKRLIGKDTSIERLIEEELAAREIGHYKQYPVASICVADKAFPDEKIAVFCDGDYWHSLPKWKERDKRINQQLRKRGWTVLRFWEKDIKCAARKIVDEIERVLRRKRKMGSRPRKWKKNAALF
ncbi:MAG: DUF559 domain-containing protein [Candidatus Micrarchaeota archaeon]|nr:DUF559 domain-containing protein [Candidatus Micrarchaeota archaeon]